MMRVKRKGEATAGKRKRTAKDAKSTEIPTKTQSINSSGDSHPSKFSAPDANRAGLRDKDWNFGGLLNGDRALLVAACWYEYARESQHVRQTMGAWLKLQEIRAQLRPFMRRIAKEWARTGQAIRARPEPIIVDETNWELVAEAEMLLRALNYDKRLPRELCEALIEAHSAEHELQRIESNEGVCAPRLRALAKYLVEDRPWLRIPEEDRQLAIEFAFKHRFEVPRSSSGATPFEVTKEERARHVTVWRRAFERIRWGDFTPPDFGEGALRKNGVSKDLSYRQITRDDGLEPWRGAGDEELPVLIRWGRFNDPEIVANFKAWVKLNRPPEWKDLADRRGRGKDNWFVAALRELAALRLRHSFRPEEAFKQFQFRYGPDRKRDSSDGADRRLETDKRNYRQLAVDAVRTFQQLFGSKERPACEVTFQRRERLRKTNLKSATM